MLSKLHHLPRFSHSFRITHRGMSSLRERVSNPAQLCFYDSLEKRVRPFELQSGQDIVRWYSCGPTVYDASHMGHARNYVTTDTLRRLLQDYFGYRVEYVQNVTDVDDKIIVKARHNLLIERYKQEHAQDWHDEKEQIRTWWTAYRNRYLDHVKTDIADWSKITPIARDLNAYPKDQMAIDVLTTSAAMLNSSLVGIQSAQFFADLREIILSGIDTPQQIVSNDQIFESTRALTTFWEKSFNDDMANLNVLPPNKIVRVTEYMDAIIEFVQEIIRNGFAYEANGSVYFNVAHFVTAGHSYAKLKPSSMSSTTEALLAEAEGSLTAQISHGKKSQRDFALWKASKAGEPFWVSPWGKGRPGWHIECSAMASSEFGKCMDIHSGGEDLTFPHHDNELAQSEAAHNCHEWVRYFLHTGHLHIRGMKMSKSLKNFITIEQALTVGGMTSRTMRLIFLSGNWRGRVDYNDDLIKGVRTTEQKFSEFFMQIRALPEASNVTQQFPDETLRARLQASRDDVDSALADDFDTPRMLNILRELLSESNKTLADDTIPLEALREVTTFFTQLFEIVGIEAAEDRIGWKLESHSPALMREVQAVAEYRQKMRDLAIKSEKLTDDPALAQMMADFVALTVETPTLIAFRANLSALLAEDVSKNALMSSLDHFRDYTLVDMGIALDDKKDGFILKSGSVDDLIARREQKLQEVRDRASKREEQRRKEAELMKRGEVRAKDMYRHDAQYTQFDTRGIPTHVRTVEGEEVEVSKSQGKKFAKDYAAQEKLNKRYDEWTAKQ